MDLDSYISFVPVTTNDTDNQLVARNLSSLISLAGLGQMTQTNVTPQQYSLDSYKFERTPLDPSLVNIKEFADNFRAIKAKLANIEEAITALEKKKGLIKSTYEDVSKKLIEFFGIGEESDVLTTLQKKAYDMIERLDLERFYEERNKLLQHYKVAVPLLNEVKDEFFKDIGNIGNCPICFEKDMSYAVYPCGHVTCEDCKKKLVSSCFQCRGPVMKVMKIYTS
jgi:hypothetical protein